MEFSIYQDSDTSSLLRRALFANLKENITRNYKELSSDVDFDGRDSEIRAGYITLLQVSVRYGTLDYTVITESDELLKQHLGITRADIDRLCLLRRGKFRR